MNRLISIIVPCYNQAHYLDECLQSVLNQTFQDWECIIVNDGSPDNTEEVAKKWVEKDKRFRYVYKENGGLSSARNFGIDAANGEIILPLDCDDKIAVRYLELAHKEFQKGYSVVYCKAQFFGTSNSEWMLPKFDEYDLLLRNLIFCSALYLKNDWKKIGGYDEYLKYGREDWEFWINLIHNTEQKVKKIDYIGFFYRRKTESMDIEINRDKLKLFSAEQFIYKKHQDKYLKYFEGPISTLNSNINKTIQLKSLESKHSLLLKNIRKNIITKLLYKIIEKL